MKELPRMKNKLMMKKIVYFLVLLLGTGLLFSCSDSKDDDGDILGYPVVSIFPYGNFIQKLKAGDSIVLHSNKKTPFSVAQVSLPGNMPEYNVDYANYQYQKVKLRWLTIIHPTDTTLILKVDSSFGSNIIDIQMGCLEPLKHLHPLLFNSSIRVIRDSIKSK